MNFLRLTDVRQVADDFDVGNFYSILTSVIGTRLELPRDRTLLLRPFETKPAQESQNAYSGNLIHCIINLSRDVILKRCMENSEYLRRELLVAEARAKSGFNHYNVQRATNLVLRDSNSRSNFEIVRGWESSTYLAIDAGDLFSKQLSELSQAEIASERFLQQFGEWAAFNYLLGIRDRHSRNFVYFPLSSKLISIDNEFGPFDTNGRLENLENIVIDMNNCIKNYIPRPLLEACLETLKHSFQHGWESVRNAAPGFTSLNTNERDLLKEHFAYDPSVVANAFFDSRYFT